MKNMSSVISNHNFKVLNSNSNDPECEPRCNCQVSKKADCPLPGQCHTDQAGRVQSVVYRAHIKRLDTGKEETYTGFTGSTFKERWYAHCNDIKNYNPNDHSYGRRMCKYVGDLNYNDIPNTISWEIVTRAPTYNPISKTCRLCILEKYHIMYNSEKSTLNVKSEFFSSCLHRRKLLLKNFKHHKIRSVMG